MILSPSARVGTIATATALCFCLPSIARADVKMVQTTTVKSTGGPTGAGNNTSTSTVYYKGNKIRTETPQQVTIIDGDTKQIYTIQPMQKTYSVASLGAAVNNPMLAMMDFKADVKITPTGRTKTIAGKTAKGYSYTSTIAISMKQSAKTQGQAANMSAMMPKFAISGESWVVESLPVSPVAQQAAVSMLRAVPGMQDFATKLSSIKGLPLESVTNVNITGGMMPGGKPMQINTHSVATQIAQAPLSTSLFAPPAGYRKVEPPTMPGMRGGAMGGRMARP